MSHTRHFVLTICETIQTFYWSKYSNTWILFGVPKTWLPNTEYYSVLGKSKYRIWILIFGPTIRIVLEYQIIRHTLLCTPYTKYCTFHTENWALHSSYCTMHTTQCTMQTSSDTKLHTLLTASFTLHIVHSTMHLAHYILQYAHSTFDYAQPRNFIFYT